MDNLILMIYLLLLPNVPQKNTAKGEKKKNSLLQVQIVINILSKIYSVFRKSNRHQWLVKWKCMYVFMYISEYKIH